MSEATQGHKGQIIKVGRNQSGSYAWIGLKTVLRLPYGDRHHLHTNKDLFLHSTDSNVPLEVGMEVAFDWIEDTARENALRAVNAIAFIHEPRHIELHVDVNGVDNPTVPVRWCFTREMHARMLEGLKDGKAYAILMVARHQNDDCGYREQREIKSPLDLFSFVTFSRPGVWDLGVILYEFSRVNAGENPKTILVRTINNHYLMKTGTRYEYGIPPLGCHGLKPEYVLRDMELSYGIAGARVIAAHEIHIDLPKTIFAAEPSETMKAFANRFYKIQPYDECELRRRLVIMIFFGGWIPWLLVEILNRFRQLLGGVLELLVAQRGSMRNIGRAFKPAVRFQVNLRLPERDENDPEWAYFYPPWNHSLTWFLNPLVVIAGGSLIRWVLYPVGRWIVSTVPSALSHAAHGISNMKAPSLGWPEFAMLVVAIVAGQFLYRRFIRESTAPTDEQKLAKRKAEAEKETAERTRLRELTISVMSDDAALAARIAPAVVCGGDVQHEVSLKAIPPELQTWRLRFTAYKRTKCRPFA